MLNKVAKSAAKQAARLEAQALRRPSALAAAQSISKAFSGNTRLGLEEAKRATLSKIAVSTSPEAVDARKERKRMKPEAAKYKPAQGDTVRTATHGSKTDKTMNSYFTAKRGDNMPKDKR